jgi:hypothetical protein
MKNESIRVEMSRFFGPPPVLSTESAEAFEEMLAELIACLQPADAIEKFAVYNIACLAWEVIRYRRHKTLLIDRKYRQRLEFQALRQKHLLDRKAASAEERARSNLPATEGERAFELDDYVFGSIEEIDEILSRRPGEIDHVRALEAAIAYHERIDELLGIALARYEAALENLDHYREVLAMRLREVTREIIRRESTTLDESPYDEITRLAEETQTNGCGGPPEIEEVLQASEDRRQRDLQEMRQRQLEESRSKK